jgi:microsomal dipeptidase-like Zn-dependent dipeptidase
VVTWVSAFDDGQFDLSRAKEGGLDAMFFSLFVTEHYFPARAETKQVLRPIDAAYAQLANNSDKIELALTASDIERISRSGRIAAFMDHAEAWLARRANQKIPRWQPAPRSPSGHTQVERMGSDLDFLIPIRKSRSDPYNQSRLAQ